jgi:hypothetical protein
MMMRRTVVSGIAMMLAAASLTLSAYAQQSSTAFTYQGFLKDNNNPANAKYDLQFTLYDAPTGGNRIGNSVVFDDLQITNGLFTVEIDFGINPFSSGQRRWIEIGIRPFNSTGSFVILDPRIELTPVPYAIYAQKAQDAVNAQNAQNAQNAENAQNAVNAQNAQNAQNAVTADVANSVAPNSVDSAGLANDANSLSKVSGGALSIENGHIKRTNNVYFYATGLKTFGVLGNNTNRVSGVYNCPPPAGSPRFARGTARSAPARFPLRAGGTLRRGSSVALVFINFAHAVGIIGFTFYPRVSVEPKVGYRWRLMK